MTIPVSGSVQIDIPFGYTVTCFGNVQAANTQQVVLTDANNNTIFTATGSNGGATTPAPMTFGNSQQYFTFQVPSGTGAGAIYTLTVTNTTSGQQESILLNDLTLNVGSTVYGTLWVLMCDDAGGGIDYNDCIFYVQACAQAG